MKANNRDMRLVLFTDWNFHLNLIDCFDVKLVDTMSVDQKEKEKQSHLEHVNFYFFFLV